MEILWAPWRKKYVQKKRQRRCIFCSALKREAGKNHVFIKNNLSFAMLNLYPYNNGHIMVCPNRHIKDLEGLTSAEMLDLFKTLLQAKKMLAKTVKPHGFNMGLNLGLIAGAGERRHIHIHLVPRWKGDTNFMPVISGTKVISQSLKDLYKRLKKC